MSCDFDGFAINYICINLVVPSPDMFGSDSSLKCVFIVSRFVWLPNK